jgi:hypothetical protein
MSYPLTFDGEPSYTVPDLRDDDDAYMTCEHCGHDVYMGDRYCPRCRLTPVKLPEPVRVP